MVFRLRSISSLFCLGLLLLPSLGVAQGMPGWSQGLHSRVRLVSGDRTGTQWLAGIDMALDPGFKTYWRNPGESGLPPRFDWAGSENVASVDVKWPAPSRSEDGAGVSYVYHDNVLLPLVVQAVDVAKPVKLVLSIEYGICKDICIPANATLALTLGAGPSQQAEIAAALHDKVPRVQAIGAPGPVSILSLGPNTDGKPGFSATLKSPPGEAPNLFVEAPEGWYFSTAKPDDHNRVSVSLDEKPKDAAGPVTVTLTLVAGQNAVESEVKLDATGKPR